MKAISTTLLIIVTAVVLLIAAVILLTMMGVNIGNISQVISDWIKQVTGAPTELCEGRLQTECSFFSSCNWCPATNKCVKIGQSCA
jgi:hypothetical protein